MASINDSYFMNLDNNPMNDKVKAKTYGRRNVFDS